MAPINDVNTTLSGGAIAGIVIAVVIFIIVLVVGIIYLARHKAAQAHQQHRDCPVRRSVRGELRPGAARAGRQRRERDMAVSHAAVPGRDGNDIALVPDSDAGGAMTAGERV